MRLGNYDDGGWDICLAGSYKPTANNCLVYSFGLVLLYSSHCLAHKQTDMMLL